RDNVESPDLIGLIAAVDRFDPARGVPFEGYAGLRIRGAVLDELRRLDDRSRGERRRARIDVADADPEIGAYGLTLSLDLLLESGDRDWAADDDSTDRYEDQDLRTRVESALKCLPPRQREVLARYYGDALTLREPAIALRWGRQRERTKSVVLPEHVRRAVALMRDLKAAFERTTDDPSVTEQRAEDDLELDRVR